MVYIKRKSCCITTPSPWAAKRGLMGGYCCFTFGFSVAIVISIPITAGVGLSTCISAIQFLKVGVLLLYMILKMPTKKLIKKYKKHIPRLKKIYLVLYSIQTFLFFVNLLMAILGTAFRSQDCDIIGFDIGGIVAGVLFLAILLVSSLLEIGATNEYIEKMGYNKPAQNGNQNAEEVQVQKNMDHGGESGGNVVTNAQIYVGPNQNIPPGQAANLYYQQPMMYQQQQVPVVSVGGVGEGYNPAQVYAPEIQQYYSTSDTHGVNIYDTSNIVPPPMPEQQRDEIVINAEPNSPKSDTGVEIIERKDY